MMILFSESYVTFAKILNGNKIDMQMKNQTSLYSCAYIFKEQNYA